MNRTFHFPSGCGPPALINTPLQRGVRVTMAKPNRFSGFQRQVETAKAVQTFRAPRATPLKRGVNENGCDESGGTSVGVWLPVWSFLLGVILLAAGCRAVPPDKPLQRFAFTHPGMGTLITITLYAPEPAAAKAAAAAAFKRIDALEDVMSDYQADSELMRLCDQPFGTPVAVSAELFDVLQRAQKISKLSDGAFDVTVGPYIRLWRFARKRKVLPTAAEIATAREAVGWQKLRLDPRARTVTLLAPNMRLDLGSIGKGYAADVALRILKGRGIDRALVAASGDIAIGNPPPGQAGWKIGVAAFDGATNNPQRTLLLRNAGISTSGDTEQFIEIGGVHYSHIVNPATGLGMTQRIQSTVIGPDATTTDTLDTTVSLLGVQRGLALIDAWPHTAALIVTKDDGQAKSFTSRRFQRIPQAH
jgi:FAD:protein FMN transferase